LSALLNLVELLSLLKLLRLHLLAWFEDIHLIDCILHLKHQALLLRIQLLPYPIFRALDKHTRNIKLSEHLIIATDGPQLVLNPRFMLFKHTFLQFVFRLIACQMELNRLEVVLKLSNSCESIVIPLVFNFVEYLMVRSSRPFFIQREM
jgi:hypothetical protein